MGRRYDFPATREDIDKCCDVKQLKEWQHQFELSLGQMESDYGGIENVSERLYKYAKANQHNLHQIKFRIRKLTGPVTSAGALKAFHDMAKSVMPRSEYDVLVVKTKMSLGKADADWDELIKYRKNARA